MKMYGGAVFPLWKDQPHDLWLARPSRTDENTKDARRVRMSERLMGTVKFFLVEKGYGFIVPDDGSEEVFVHASNISVKNFPLLEAGEQVTYELIPGRKFGHQAANVTIGFDRDLDDDGFDDDDYASDFNDEEGDFPQ